MPPTPACISHGGGCHRLSLPGSVSNQPSAGPVWAIIFPGKVAPSLQLFLTPWIVAHQAPLSMGFSRQEYWSGLPFLSPGIFLTQGPNPYLSPALTGRFFTTSATWKAGDNFQWLLKSLYGHVISVVILGNKYIFQRNIENVKVLTYK